MTLSVVADAARDAELLQPRYKGIGVSPICVIYVLSLMRILDTMDEAIVICQTCRHGGHASHILDWFYREDGARLHDVCAVADCDCRCADEM